MYKNEWISRKNLWPRMLPDYCRLLLHSMVSKMATLVPGAEDSVKDELAPLSKLMETWHGTKREQNSLFMLLICSVF